MKVSEIITWVQGKRGEGLPNKKIETKFKKLMMKKSVKLILNKARDMEDENRDPVDGRSMVGCLFVGILILAVMLYTFSLLIKYLR